MVPASRFPTCILYTERENMSFQRTDRLAEEIQREVDDIIRHELNDPRIDGTYSVTRVEVTRDLRYAKVFVSILEDDKRGPLMEALDSARGYIRRTLGKNMRLRYTPEVLFVSDQNIAYGVHIAQVLSEVTKGENHDEP